MDTVKSLRRFIPLADARLVRPLPQALEQHLGAPTDVLGRALSDLRISVTDRCNFRCGYCMPKEVFDREYKFLPPSQLLSFEQIVRLARAFKSLGVRKVRITGGEPLLRRDVEKLIEQLVSLDGLEVTLTTNGSLLARKAAALRAAGLHRLNVSLDALDEKTFGAMNGVDFPVSDVIRGIDAARAAGFESIKVNMVVKRGVNDHAIVPMARYFRHTGHVLRFIEFMDVGSTNGWKLESVVPSAKIVERINAEFPLEPLGPNYRGEVAERWTYRDGKGEIGVISSVTQTFCRQCTRARISPEGRLFTCLFASDGFDLRPLVLSGASDAEIAGRVAAVWTARGDRYSELRSTSATRASRIEMSYIGG
jgi:cyclic pyranopterin phosphate synthase